MKRLGSGSVCFTVTISCQHKSKQDRIYAQGICFIKKNQNLILTGIKAFSLQPSCSAAAAKSLQSCLTLCDPIDGTPPGSPVSGFSRQEHWSGLPFPSPMHESEKWKLSLDLIMFLFLKYCIFPGCSAGKDSACNTGDLGSIPGLGRYPEGGHGNPLQYSGESPWTEEPDRLQSMGSQRVRHD